MKTLQAKLKFQHRLYSQRGTDGRTDMDSRSTRENLSTFKIFLLRAESLVEPTASNVYMIVGC